MKSYLLEVLATNTFQKRFILLNTTQDMIRMGFRPESIRSVACFEKPILKGFYLTGMPLMSGTIPGQKEIIDAYQKWPALFGLRHNPVIGEIQSGHFAGQRIALFTQNEIREYFSIDAIRMAIKRDKLYCHTRWRKARSYAEAQPYYCRQDKHRIMAVLRQHYTYSVPTLTRGDHLIFRREVKNVVQHLRAWMVKDYPHQTHVAIERLVDIYLMLARTIRCEDHYLKLANTLWVLGGMLLENKPLTLMMLKNQVYLLEMIVNNNGRL